MEVFEVAVLIATYQPDWNKLHATLRSVLEQCGVKVQIVIADDGSVNNHFDKIKDYLKKCNFDDYTLIENKENKGTVANVLNGLYAVKANYVKIISPGDLLYNELTLKNWMQFIVDNNAEISFSQAVFYRPVANEAFEIIKHEQHPNNMRAYLQPLSYIDRVITYILLEDGISGATVLLKRDILMKYMKLLIGRVIYAEDIFMRLAILEKVDIKYYPFPGIWYEYGNGGISTTPGDKWCKRLRKDAYEMGKICLERYSDDDVRILDILNEHCRRNASVRQPGWKKRWKLLRHPRWWYWERCRRIFVTYAPMPENIGFLRKCFSFGKDDR